MNYAAINSIGFDRQTFQGSNGASSNEVPDNGVTRTQQHEHRSHAKRPARDACSEQFFLRVTAPKRMKKAFLPGSAGVLAGMGKAMAAEAARFMNHCAQAASFIRILPAGTPALPGRKTFAAQFRRDADRSELLFSKQQKLVQILTLAMSFLITGYAIAEQNQTTHEEISKSAAQSTIETLRAEIAAIRTDYEARIKQLESRLEELQVQMLRTAPETPAPAVPPATAPQTMASALNPAISVVGNLVGRADSQKVFGEDGNRTDNRMILREAEIDMRVPVDPYADGILITAFESDTLGRFSAGIEEGYVNIKKLPFIDRPPLGLKLKVGRFRPLFGTANVLHTHDLPQTFRPLPIQEFLGPEGFVKDGISANFFLPTPWENASLDLTLDALTGGDIAFSPDLASRVSYLGHLRYFQTFRNAHSLQLGWSSYFHPKGNGVREADIHGFDLLYRWKPARMGEWKSFLLGSEFMFGRRAFPEAAESPDVAQAISASQPGTDKPLGFYLFAQSQFNRRTYAGLRYDQTGVLFNPALKRRSVTPYLSYYFSEFLRFRLNYEHRWSDLITENRRNSVYAELNFVFGSHPPEPFWVNK